MWVLFTMEFSGSWILGGYHDELRRQTEFRSQVECEAAIVKLRETLPGLAMICKMEDK